MLPSKFSAPRQFGVILPVLVLSFGCGSPSGPTPSTLALSAISPSAGSIMGGTAVTLSGRGFSSDATVTIGGAPATNVAVQSAETITALTPAAAAGAADVVVTSGGRSASLARGFTFVAPSGANQAPAIASIRSVGTRPNQPNGFADLDETVTLIATVTDVETAPASLTYAWSGAGTFTGTGATVSWHVPANLSPTPSLVTVTLTVTEQFSEGGVTHRNTTTGTFTMRVHDSQKEILDIGEDFLTLFSRSEVPTDQVLHNFSGTCDSGRGRADEKSDVDRDRATVTHGAFTITRLPPVRFNFGGACVGKIVNRADACAQFNAHWEITYKVNVDAIRRRGTRAITDGVDFVTAVYENSRWLLCHSNFEGTERFPTLGLTRQVSW